MQGSRFPAGSVRAAVELHGNAWAAFDLMPARLDRVKRAGVSTDGIVLAASCATGALFDFLAMKKSESLRRAGATPAQRASWLMFNERNAAAALAMPHPTT